MPLTLDVGLSRKVGEANYGSRGASVNLAVELESGLVKEPQQLQARIRQLFDLVRASVDDELNNPSEQDRPNGHQNGHAGSSVPPATSAQIRALHAIAERKQLDLGRVVRDQFDVAGAENLTIQQASGLIDHLKAQRTGSGRQLA